MKRCQIVSAMAAPQSSKHTKGALSPLKSQHPISRSVIGSHDPDDLSKVRKWLVLCNFLAASNIRGRNTNHTVR